MFDIEKKRNRKFKPDFLREPRDFVVPKLADRQYLEIGAGRGLHALKFAEENPESHLIAIERTKNKCHDFLSKAAKQQSENLLAVHADAIPWTVCALPPCSLSGIFILYPNPEPKNPAQRWLNMPYFEFLLSRLKHGGTIVLASNIEGYIEEAYQQAQEVWKIPVERVEVARSSARTHFEIKYLARGEVCQELRIQRPDRHITRFDYYSRV